MNTLNDLAQRGESAEANCYLFEQKPLSMQ